MTDDTAPTTPPTRGMSYRRRRGRRSRAMTQSMRANARSGSLRGALHLFIAVRDRKPLDLVAAAVRACNWLAAPQPSISVESIDSRNVALTDCLYLHHRRHV